MAGDGIDEVNVRHHAERHAVGGNEKAGGRVRRARMTQDRLRGGEKRQKQKQCKKLFHSFSIIQ